MADDVSISFTGKVSRVNETSKAFAVTIEIDDGGKYPQRCTVWTDERLSVGDVVEVSTRKFPYVKVNEGHDRQGNPKTYYDIVVPSATVNVVGGAPAEPFDLDGSEIPF